MRPLILVGGDVHDQISNDMILAAACSFVGLVPGGGDFGHALHSQPEPSRTMQRRDAPLQALKC